MNNSRRFAVAAVVFLVTLRSSGVYGQGDNNRRIEQYTCKDVMRESGANRDVAIAFLHGYLLGKTGNSTFNLDVLHKQTSDFIERCLDNPGEKALDAMLKITG